MLQAIRRLSPFELATLVPSHTHTLLMVQSRDWVPGRCKYYGATSGREVLQNLHPLTNFKAAIRAQASAIASSREDRVDSDLGNGLDSGMLHVSVPFCLLPR
jgi:hypothetical protein